MTKTKAAPERTVACVVVRSPKPFSWLGHMPILNWTVAALADARGVGRVVCVTDAKLAPQAGKLLAKQDVTVHVCPPDVLAKDAALEAWLLGSTGPAAGAEVVVVAAGTTPFMPAAKIEACVAAVARKRCTTCHPARDRSVVGNGRKAATKEAVEGVRAFRMERLHGATDVGTVPVSLIESLDVDDHDAFVMADALVLAGKV